MRQKAALLDEKIISYLGGEYAVFLQTNLCFINFQKKFSVKYSIYSTILLVDRKNTTQIQHRYYIDSILKINMKRQIQKEPSQIVAALFVK